MDKVGWHWSAQFALAIVVVLVVAGLVLYPPIYTSRLLVEAGVETTGALDVWAPMLAVFVALTAVTISGTFIFMTFRIDRGTKRTAREEARKKARKTAKKVAARKAKKKAETAAKDLRTRIGKLVDCTKADLDCMKNDMDERLKEFPGRAKAAADCVDAIKARVQESAADVQGKADKVSEDVAKVDALLNDKAETVVQEAINAALDGDEKLQERIGRLLDPQALERALLETLIRRALKDHPTEELEEHVRRLMSILDKWLPPWKFGRKRTG